MIECGLNIGQNITIFLIKDDEIIPFPHNRQEHVILGRGTTYLIHPENYGFVPKDGPPLSEKNKYLAIGVHKSIRYVEGPDGRDSKKVGLIVESKKVSNGYDKHLLLLKSGTIHPEDWKKWMVEDRDGC
jgi:hypothetical protein